MACIYHGPAAKGSQRWVQRLVTEKPDLLKEDSRYRTVRLEEAKGQQGTFDPSSRLV